MSPEEKEAAEIKAKFSPTQDDTHANDIAYFVKWAEPLIAFVVIVLGAVCGVLVVMVVNLQSTLDENYNAQLDRGNMSRSVSCQVILDLRQQLPDACKVQGVVEKLMTPDPPKASS